MKPGLSLLTGAVCALVCFIQSAGACAAVGRAGKPVVNADQSVIIIWDAAAGKQHFVRRASFRSADDDVGFLVPTPARPELSESGDAAFQTMEEITAPPPESGGGFPIGCSATPKAASRSYVRVLEEKSVAGFRATVLQAGSAAALTAWLGQHGYQFSPAVEEWARPYVDQGWMISAMKVEKDASGRTAQKVNAGALRMSFSTARPLFPYREPASTSDAASLKVPNRLLRIFFVADKRYDGALEGGGRWSGRTEWSGKITAGERASLLKELALPATTGPEVWHVTKFDDIWPYAKATGDLYFSPASSQRDIGRATPATPVKSMIAFAAVGLALVARSRLRKRVAALG